MDILGKIIGWEKIDGAYLLKGDCADIKLHFLTDEVIRVRVSFDRDFPEESYVLMTTAWEDRLDPLFEGERERIDPVNPVVSEQDGLIFFTTAKLRLKIRKDPFELELEDKNGNRRLI